MSSGRPSAPANATVRDIARISLGGTATRIRLANPNASLPLVIGAATIALQQGSSGTTVILSSTRQITFNGQNSITVAPKTDYVYSDAIAFSVKAQQNVAVNLYLPMTNEPFVTIPTWNASYVTANGVGDTTSDESGASFTASLSSLHGYESDYDKYDRIPDLISARIASEIPAGLIRKSPRTGSAAGSCAQTDFRAYFGTGTLTGAEHL